MRIRIDLGSIAGIAAAIITLISIILGVTLGPEGSSTQEVDITEELPGDNPEFPIPEKEEEDPIVIPPKEDTEGAPQKILAYRTDDVTVIPHQAVTPGIPFQINRVPSPYNSTSTVTVTKADGSAPESGVAAKFGQGFVRYEVAKGTPTGQRYVASFYTDGKLVAEGTFTVVNNDPAPAVSPSIASDASGWAEAPRVSPKGTITKPADTPFPINYKITDGTGYLTPGIAYYSDRPGGVTKCSAGFFITIDGEEYMITAGHCGDVGTVIFIYDANYNEVPVGKFVEVEHDGAEYSHGQADWALVKLFDSAKVDPAIGGQFPVSGYMSVKDLPSGATICHLGDTTGYQCGSALSGRMNPSTKDITFATVTANQGDSGGATFTVIDGHIYAVGVASAGGGQYYGFQEIDSVLRAKNATFYGSMK